MGIFLCIFVCLIIFLKKKIVNEAFCIIINNSFYFFLILLKKIFINNVYTHFFPLILFSVKIFIYLILNKQKILLLSIYK